jgi:23S rRNA pseudouridine1911/1915/1917 synthase
MVVSKNDRAHRALVEEFARRGVVKRYAAIVTGKPAAEHEIIDRPIGRHPKYGHKMTITEKGREARTEFRLKKIWNTRAGLFSLLEVLLHTGRTHQIRVHLSSLGLPIVGDPVYSKKWEKHRVPHLLLASVYLEFTHPISGERVHFEIPPPEHMLNFVKKLENIG